MANRESLWLGGLEPTVDGDWHWTDGAAFWSGGVNGTAVGGLFTNWDSREPNNAVGPEACLSMPLNDTTWFDYHARTGSTSPASSTDRAKARRDAQGNNGGPGAQCRPW